MRVLTTKYLSYAVGQWERRNGKAVLDLLDVGNLELNKMAQTIKLGIPKLKAETEEEHIIRVYERIDNFLAQEDKGLVDLLLQVLREYDMDFKILKASGTSIEKMEAEMKEEMKKNIEKSANKAVSGKEEDKEEDKEIEDKEIGDKEIGDTKLTLV